MTVSNLLDRVVCCCCFNKINVLRIHGTYPVLYCTYSRPQLHFKIISFQRMHSLPKNEYIIGQLHYFFNHLVLKEQQKKNEFGYSDKISIIFTQQEDNSKMKTMPLKIIYPLQKNFYCHTYLYVFLTAHGGKEVGFLLVNTTGLEKCLFYAVHHLNC